MIDFLKYYEIYNLIKDELKDTNIKRLERGLEDSMKLIKSDKTNNDFKKEIDWIKNKTLDHNIIKKYNDKINNIYSRKETKLMSLEWGKTLMILL